MMGHAGSNQAESVSFLLGDLLQHCRVARELPALTSDRPHMLQ
jgi:hypothetical protein